MGFGSRVAVIGAGSVGATISYALLIQKISSEIILVDIVEEVVQGQVLDLSDANFISSTQIRGGTFQEAGQCDIIIITAGAKQKPTETRVELIERNYKILDSVIKSMQPIKSSAILLLVANPVDILTYIAQKLSGLPKNQVIGSGTFLDSARLRLKIASSIGVAENAVHAYVLGEHGDSQIIAWSSAHIGGKPLLDFPELKNIDKEKFAKEISGKAYEIIKLKGATYFGIAGCVSSLVQCIVLNQKHVRPLSTFIEEYGCVLSMPVVLGSNGIERMIEIHLDSDEKAKLKQSAVALKQICDKYVK
ncbi:lactate dehydrogenase [Rhizophagus irregularis]|uniref:L-lactate dehydrogenase n=1 Tax=Rhizophagus irregularis TaxID=588596 RepID=A0A2I1GBJ7_9GLOM|nr:lactate dehydrogenase [Rhizophagus irregularis]